MIRLFDYYRSSASYRVRIGLNLKGVDYERIDISLVDGAQREPDNLARNPQGFVPTLEIDGHQLTQSLAILDYLDAKYDDPPFVSSDPARRSKTLAQALLIACDIHPLNNLRVLRYLGRELGAFTLAPRSRSVPQAVQDSHRLRRVEVVVERLDHS